jgi:deoxycytidine triphosphate deaminase
VTTEQPETTPAPPGTLLSGPRLLAALRQPDHIFRDGSWDESLIKGAGYELRLAKDYLVVPARDREAGFETVRPGEAARDEFVLEPGDSALVSTQEKFCMGFDVSALLGPKFSWSAKGLLVLHGMVAHPGYGRAPDESGAWVPKDDERLYLIVANIGPGPIHMRAGDRIAYIQFFSVEPAERPRAIDNVGFDFLNDRLFSRQASAPGLAYFKMFRDLKVAFDADQVARTTELAGLRAEVAAAQQSVDRVRSSTEYVVVFGVFLVAATLFGVTLDALVHAVGELPSDAWWGRTVIVSALCVAYAAAMVTGVVMVVKAIGKRARDDAQGGTTTK